VFQDAPVDKTKQKQSISASITIRPLLDESYYQYNTMRYFSEQKGDDYLSFSSIHFNVFIEPTAFRELVSNTIRGLYPEAITIDLVSPPFFTTGTNKKTKAIEFGWEPDGSRLIWHNTETENQIIPIESVTFDYAPADRVTEQTALILRGLAQMLKYARWIIVGIAAIAIMVAISMFKRGMLF
jgi:hypothetical protein